MPMCYGSALDNIRRHNPPKRPPLFIKYQPRAFLTGTMLSKAFGSKGHSSADATNIDSGKDSVEVTADNESGMCFVTAFGYLY